MQQSRCMHKYVCTVVYCLEDRSDFCPATCYPALTIPLLKGNKQWRLHSLLWQKAAEIHYHNESYLCLWVAGSFLCVLSKPHNAYMYTYYCVTKHIGSEEYFKLCKHRCSPMGCPSCVFLYLSTDLKLSVSFLPLWLLCFTMCYCTQFQCFNYFNMLLLHRQY